MEEIFQNLYSMTAFSNIIAEPQFLIMYAIAFILLYLLDYALLRSIVWVVGVGAVFSMIVRAALSV